MSSASMEEAEGRSPRVRGSPSRRRERLPAGGSIPAGAGKPRRGWRQPPARGVDPRGCGEAEYQRAKVQRGKGRSPRVRGSPLGIADLDISSGSIPAGAGKPRTPSRDHLLDGVDPRGCGEARIRIPEPDPDEGRSPRVRGSPPRTGLRRGSRGSIPAGAGKPGPTPSTTRSTRVDPRGCGEAAFIDGGQIKSGGRSPRVRGSRPGRRQHASVRGSIPAGAGKPRWSSCAAAR